jgi:hypothetical protein
MTQEGVRILQIVEKKWEYDKTVHQLFKDLKKNQDSGGSQLPHNTHWIRCQTIGN